MLQIPTPSGSEEALNTDKNIINTPHNPLRSQRESSNTM